MTAPRSYDAIVVGAGTNGLAAAAYLGMAGKRVLIVEARADLGGLSETSSFGPGLLFSRGAHVLYALDPRVVRELKLARHGLKFAVRDMALAGLRPDGKHVVLTRDSHASARNIALHSSADAQAFPGFRRDWYARARKLRSLWWQTAGAAPLNERYACFARLSASAWLDGAFESEALKATLGFDGYAMSPLAAGSALLLVWRAAQEMAGLQGAVALPRGGLRTLTDSLAAAARSFNVDIRTHARVVDLALDQESHASGVVLGDGEVLFAPLILSSLSRARTLSFASVRDVLSFGQKAKLARGEAGIAMARVTLALDRLPAISGASVPATARMVVLDRLESLAAAHAEAYAGRMPQELAIEAIVPTAADPALAPVEHHIVSVLAGPVPSVIAGGWRAQKPVLAAKVVSALARHMPGLGHHLVAADVMTPDDVREGFGCDDCCGGAVGAGRLLADWRDRIRTPVPGLLLCGAAADLVGAISGRGGRAAVALALAKKEAP